MNLKDDYKDDDTHNADADGHDMRLLEKQAQQRLGTEEVEYGMPHASPGHFPKAAPRHAGAQWYRRYTVPYRSAPLQSCGSHPPPSQEARVRIKVTLMVEAAAV
mgnify:CR=1 FL=1